MKKVELLLEFLRKLSENDRVSVSSLDGDTIPLAEELVSRGLITKKSTTTNSYYYLKGTLSIKDIEAIDKTPN